MYLITYGVFIINKKKYIRQLAMFYNVWNIGKYLHT